VARGYHAERTGALVGVEQEVIHVAELAAIATGDVIGWRGEQIQGPREGVVDGDLLGATADEEEAAATALFDAPPGEIIFVVGYPGEEDIRAADSGSDVWVGAAADGREEGAGGAHGIPVDDLCCHCGRDETIEHALSICF